MSDALEFAVERAAYQRREREAAARIEQLEAALREHACGCVDRCFEDRLKYGEYTKFEDATCSGAKARAALEERT